MRRRSVGGALAQVGGTLVLFMSVLQIEANLQRLIGAGLAPDTPAAAVRWGTTARQVLIATAATLPAGCGRGCARRQWS